MISFFVYTIHSLPTKILLSTLVLIEQVLRRCLLVWLLALVLHIVHPWRLNNAGASLMHPTFLLNIRFELIKFFAYLELEIFLCLVVMLEEPKVFYQELSLRLHFLLLLFWLLVLLTFWLVVIIVIYIKVSLLIIIPVFIYKGLGFITVVLGTY